MPPQLRGIRKKIFQALDRAIADESYPPGSKLPTLRELGQQYGTSHANVAAAVQHLADQGLLVKRQGSGVYVSRRQPPVSGRLNVHCVYEMGTEIAGAIARFQATNPDIVLSTDAPEATADVTFYGAIGIRHAAREGDLLSLDGLMHASDVSRDSFHPQALRAGLDGGSLYALPVVFSPDILFCNPALAALPDADLEDWTLDAFRDHLISQRPALTARGVRPFGAGNSYLGQVRSFLAPFGAAEVDPSASLCLLDQPEALDALSYVRSLVDLSHNVEGPVNRIPDLLEGQAAFATMPGLLYPRLLAAGPAVVRPLPLPVGHSRPREVSGLWVAVRSGCAQPDAAWRLIEHMVGEATQRQIAQAHLLFPARRDALAYLRQLDADTYGPLLHYLDRLDCQTPPLRRADLFQLDSLLQDWRTARDLPALLARASEAFTDHLRQHELARIPEFVGL